MKALRFNYITCFYFSVHSFDSGFSGSEADNTCMRFLIIPAVLIAGLTLTGCSQDTERQFTTEGGVAASNSTATPAPSTGSTEKITSPDTVIGDTDVTIGTVGKDGTFNTPKIDINAEAPADKPAEEKAVFNDFKSVIVNSLKKMNETGLVQNYTVDGKTSVYVLVKNGDTMKAAVKFPDFPTPDLLQTVNVFVPVMADMALNNRGGNYTANGNSYIVNGSNGVYTFTVNDGLITSMSITGTDKVKFSPINVTVEYTTTDAARAIADTAVLPPF